MIDDLIDTITSAAEEALSLETVLTVLFVLVLISVYFGMGLPGSTQVMRFVGVQPRNPVSDGSGSGSGSG